MPTTSAPARTSAYTIRSPSASTLASPLPLDHAMIHDSVNWLAATTPAAMSRRVNARASYTQIRLQTKVATPCSTSPVATMRAADATAA